MMHEADADLLCPKQKGEGIDVRRPKRFVPGVIGDKDRVATYRLNGFHAPAPGNLHRVASRQ